MSPLTRLSSLLCSGLLVLGTGCSTPPSSLPAATPDTTTLATAGGARVTAQSVRIGETMRKHRRANYNLDGRTYDFYIGGLLEAAYHPWNNTLTVIGTAGTPLCHYDAEGFLTAEGDSVACADLLAHLETALAH